MNVLLITPPMVQLNAPYPATPCLAGFLQQHGHTVTQRDLSLELALRLFSETGLRQIETVLQRTTNKRWPDSVKFFLRHAERYASAVDPAVRYLQDRDPTLAYRIVTREFLPEGPRFDLLRSGKNDSDTPVTQAFGSLGTHDAARWMASLLLDDIADTIREGLDPRFELARYAESLAASAPRFAPLRKALLAPPGLIDNMIDQLASDALGNDCPDLVGITVPFPGNLYGALRIARRMRALRPDVHIVLGGGYVNTELLHLSDPGIFDFVDTILLGDGERPLLALIEHLGGHRPPERLMRAFQRERGKVVFHNDPALRDIPHQEVGTPVYDGLPLDRYLSMIEMLNPMHRLWSDGRWNKLLLSHGCYWHRCAFCDTRLDHIARYSTARPDTLVDRIEAIMAATGQSGFHFVDESASPAVLAALAKRLLARRVRISWWGNIRFERGFTPEVVDLLARSGCVGITGGLEAACDRLLRLMKKGVTVSQASQVMRAFADRGILVHAYLMYAFPSQTDQETVDALETVRRLFVEGCLHSAYWHRFALTCHSPISHNPKAFGIRIARKAKPFFAENEISYTDPALRDPAGTGLALRTATYNYMHGVGLDKPAHEWFNRPMPPPTVNFPAFKGLS